MYDVNVYYKVKTSIGRSEFIYFHLSLAAYLVLTERDSYFLTVSECDVISDDRQVFVFGFKLGLLACT